MSKPNPKFLPFRRGLSLGVAAGALVASAAAVAAAPEDGRGPHEGGRLHAVAMHGGGMHGGMGWRLGADPARVDRRVDRMLHGLDVSDDQAARIRNIARAAAQDLQGLREARRSLHEQARQVWTQPTVDANAVEALRQQQMALVDQRSRRMSQAMLEISHVLTPEQRTRLAERMEQRRRHLRERASEPPRSLPPAR